MSLLLAFAAGAGAGVLREVVSRGGRSWRIRPSYKIFVPSFAPVRNNLRLSEAEPRVGVDADHAIAARHGASSGGGVLVEGLACVLPGGRVAEVLAWARGARVRVVGTPPRAPALDSRHSRKAGRVAAGGCFGNGFIAGLAQFSYKSKNLFTDRKTTPPDACRAAFDHRCGLCHQRSGWRPRRHGDPCCSGCGERLRASMGRG